MYYPCINYPCIIHVLIIHVLSMYYPCIVHVLPMYYPCITHVLPMYYPCITHVLPMYYPCITHVLPMYYPCIIHPSIDPSIHPCVIMCLSAVSMPSTFARPIWRPFMTYQLNNDPSQQIINFCADGGGSHPMSCSYLDLTWFFTIKARVNLGYGMKRFFRLNYVQFGIDPIPPLRTLL